MNIKPITIFFLLVFSGIIISGCKNDRQNNYDRLMKHANSIRIVDTHEHQRSASAYKINEYNLFALIAHSYLSSDLVTAGGIDIDDNMLNELSLDSLWKLHGKYLGYSSNTSYYKHLNAGIQQLYDFKEPVFTAENTKALSEQIAKNYKDYDAWFDKGFKQANIATMLVDRYWDSFNTKIDTSHFSLIFNINKIVSEIGRGAKENYKGEFREDSYYHFSDMENYPMGTLDEYLAFADHLFRKFVSDNVVAVKNTLAYSRTLDFQNVSYEKADSLFKKAPSISRADKKALEDFMFHWIIKKSIVYNLPIQIHTGYFAGNYNDLKNGDPLKLNDLLLQYPKATFVLFHGGFPWTTEFVALGKTFPNVYLDLVWLPQISKQNAIRTFNEMLDCVPYNKILYGADCHFIEEALGSIQFGKEVVVEVLADRISRGSMSEEMALDIIKRIFRENAIELFKLKVK